MRWRCVDAVWDSPSNIPLLILGCLRYLGRAWILDDIEESNGISREVNRIFLQNFLEYGSTVLFKKWVIKPAKNMKI